MTVQENIIEFVGQTLVKMLSQPDLPLSFRRNFLHGELDGFSKTNDSRNIQGTGTKPSFMAASKHDRSDADPRFFTSDVQRSDSFGTIDLVGRHGEQVDVHCFHINRNLSHPLRCITVKKHPPFTGHLTNLRERIQGSDFIIASHQGNQDRVFADRGFQLFQINSSVFIHIQKSYFIPFLLESLAGINHRLMLDWAGDDMFSFFMIKFRHAKNCHVIGFSGTAGKNDLFSGSADGLSDDVSCFRNPFLSSPTKGMIPASRIAIDLSKKWQHRLHDPRVRWSRCVVIKINGLFHDVFFLRLDFQNRIH